MKKIFIFILLFLSLFVLSNVFSVSFAQNNDHVTGQILVKFKQDTPADEIDKQLKSHRAKILDKIGLIDVLVLAVPPNAEEKVVQAFSKNPSVEYAELDYLAQAFLTTDDPYFELQWGLENTGQVVNQITGIHDADINAPTAWDITQGNVNVAVLDTGINENHPDLTGKVLVRADFTNSSSGTNDVYGHGTHVAGIIAANTNNTLGIAGVCPACTLQNVKVLNDSGSGAYSWIAKGISWAAQNQAKVINMSLGGPTKSRTLEDAVNSAFKSGVVLVAAAGNSNNPSKTYPAAYQNVIAVAATDNTDKKASFSSYGAKWVDVAAPGVYIFSTYPQCDITQTECYKYASGTSMSTPMVAAVAGLVWSTPYGTSASSVRSRLELTADKIAGTGSYWSSGRLNAASAVTP